MCAKRDLCAENGIYERRMKFVCAKQDLCAENHA